MRGRVMRSLVIACAALVLAGCSVRPIPDDVSSVPTEDIVRSMRCETKLAVRSEIAGGLKKIGLPDMVPDNVLQPQNMALIRQRDKQLGDNLAERMLAYSLVAIAYEFDFSITEDNGLGASAGFSLPFSNGLFGLAAKSDLVRRRDGKRVFKTAEQFKDLVKLNCDRDGKAFEVRDKDLVYPITGSIGMTKAIHTFIELSEQGGAEKFFTDTLTFTTSVSASITPKLTLSPVPNSFRLVSLDGNASAARTDVHKVTISLAFPDLKLLPAALGGDTALLSAQTKDRALENLCVARATNREDASGTLRLYPPEAYCRQSTAGRTAFAAP
jgi:hypothetical protein